MKKFDLAFTVIFSLCLLTSGSLHAAQKNAWYFPLEIKAGLSSTFGEFRGERVHTGIDLRTNGQNGYEVYAIDDGTITRLSVTKLGFGNALYIEHPNGLMSVYGHLERFEEKVLGLQTVVQQYRQQRGSKYPGNIYLEKPVKKGQLIGYSGETGYGLPHLHLEVRRGGATPIDPFEHGFEYEDKTPPTIESLEIEPLGSQSFLDGEHFAQEFRTEKQQGQYVIKSVPKISGKVRFTASAYDQIGAENRCAIEQIDLYIAYCGVDKVDLKIDQEKFFSNQFDQVTYDTNKRGGLVYDYNFTRLSNPTQYYYRLYNLSPALFPYRKVVSKNNGIWDTTTCKEGKHTITLEVHDVGGNISRTQMQVEVTKNPSLVSLPSLSMKPGEKWQMDVRDFHDFLEIVFQTKSPLANAPTLQITQSRSSPVTLTMSPRKVQTPGVSKDSGSFVTTYDLTPDKDGTLNLTVQAKTKTGQQIEETRQFPVNTIIAAKGGTVIYGSKVSMFFPAGALYQDIFANIFPTTAYQETPGLPLIGEVYDFRPAGCPLDKRGNIRIQYPAEIKNVQKLGIFWWDSIKKIWYFMDDQREPQTHSLTAEIIYPSIYAILQDNLNPVIADIVPADGSTVAANLPELSAIISDVGKGVDEASIVMKLDGKAVDGEYDPDRDKYAYPLTKTLKAGTHTISVQAADKAGNPAKAKTIQFTVK